MTPKHEDPAFTRLCEPSKVDHVPMPRNALLLLNCSLLLLGACFNPDSPALEMEGETSQGTTSQIEHEATQGFDETSQGMAPENPPDATGDGSIAEDEGSETSIGSFETTGTGSPEDSTTETGGPPALACDPATTPPSDAVFVATDGQSGGDGSLEDPVSSITDALEIAAQSGANFIAIADGTYAESVRISFNMVEEDGLIIQGGWIRTPTLWTLNCETTNDEVVIETPLARDPTVSVHNGVQDLTIQNITLRSPNATAPAPSGADGTSVMTVALLGVLIDVSLTDVIITSGNASSGRPGTNGNSVTGTLASSCAQGRFGNAGAPGQTVAGGFTDEGFVPGHGETGRPGDAGEAGVLGSLPNPSSCVTNCEFFPGSQEEDLDPTCIESRAYATPGPCGHGGVGGQPGTGGGGGGASIGVFASGEGTKVRLVRVSVTSGDAGQGGAPGMGSNGVSGTDGQPGTGASGCINRTECSGVLETLCENVSPASSIPAGSSGGAGGHGGQGGRGGGGAGGSSHAVVVRGGATIESTDCTFITGDRGLGASGAPNGSQEPILELP